MSAKSLMYYAGRVMRVLVWSIVPVLAGAELPRAVAQVTLDPASIDISLEPGQQHVETKTVTLPGGSPGTPVDIYFLADTTGSMDPVLDQVQADAEATLLYLSTSLQDGRFGLGEYKDFPRDAFAFRNNASLTSDIATVLAGIDGLSRDGGGDGCEGQLFALDQIADPSDPFGIGFRPEAQKIIVWFGDAPGHDPVCTAISGHPYDITEASVTAKLVGSGLTVIAIGTTTGFMYALNHNPHQEYRHYRDYDGVCEIGGSSGQADRITAATDGVSFQDVDPEDISEAILDAIEFVVSRVTVGLTPSGDIVPLTEILTPPYVDTPLPLSPDEFLELEFQVRFTGGACDPNLALHLFTGNIDAIVDGSVAASQDVTIRQPACDLPPICDAGGPYSVECQEGTTSIQLDGTASHDPPSDDVITFVWSTDRPDASFDDDTSSTPTLTLASDGACASTATVYLTVTDQLGLTSECQTVVEVADTTGPSFDTFPPDQTIQCGDSTDPASVGEPTGHDVCGDATITYTDATVGGCGDTETITRTWRVQDACGNHTEQDQIITVVDSSAPIITCPSDVTILCNERSDPDAVGWATATDDCDPSPTVSYSDDIEIQPCWWDGVVTRTWTVTDACGNESTCSQTITVLDPRIPRALAGESLPGFGSQAAAIFYDLVKPPPEKKRARLTSVADQSLVPRIALDRVSISAKGSLLVYPKIELRWSSAGDLIQDTFLTLNNDIGADVTIQMYFVGETCAYVDNVITLTENEAAYWSSALGQPKGVSPLTVLGEPYPDPQGSDDLVLRGYLILWAIDDAYAQIRWNHLTGSATIVHYYGGAWEYSAYAFQGMNVDNGEPIGTGGIINLDGNEYGIAFEQLLLDFFASGSPAFSGGGRSLVHDTDLTLLILRNDFRRDAPGPDTTKAAFEIFNENEVGFSEMEYCFTKWDSSLLSYRGGHFLLESLQTDKGQARISGVESDACPGSTSQALLGVAVDIMTFE